MLNRICKNNKWRANKLLFHFLRQNSTNGHRLRGRYFKGIFSCSTLTFVIYTEQCFKYLKNIVVIFIYYQKICPIRGAHLVGMVLENLMCPSWIVTLLQFFLDIFPWRFRYFYFRNFSHLCCIWVTVKSQYSLYTDCRGKNISAYRKL